MLKNKTKILLVSMAAVIGLTTGCTTYQSQGGLAGGGMGGLAGALLDRKNPWRGGVIGAALGGVAGATISEISVRGARESASTGKPVVYRTDDGHGYYEAAPVSQSNAQTKCKKVRERVYEGDRIVKDHIKEVCEGEKFERSY